MNIRKLIPPSILILVVALLCLNVAFAAPPEKVKVTGADPNSALQGAALDVDISGSGFDVGSTVKFLVTGSKDASQISVGAIVLNNDGTLTASIQVLNGATVTDYDIEVQASSGRRGKGTTLFKVQSSGNGGGNVNPRYDVAIWGDVSGSGTEWLVESPGIDSISYFNGQQGYTGGDGFMDFGFFTIPGNLGGAFSGQRGENCFGNSFPILLKAAALEQRNDGSAYAHFTIYAKTDDGQNEIQYHLDMTGTIDDPYDWSPQGVNTMNLTTWKLLLGANKYNKHTNIACLGESTGGAGFLTVIDVVRTN